MFARPLTPTRVLKPFCDFTYGVFLLLGFFKDRAERMATLPALDGGASGVDPAFVSRLPPVEVGGYPRAVPYGQKR